jgi:hypothetical protein
MIIKYGIYEKSKGRSFVIMNNGAKEKPSKERTLIFLENIKEITLEESWGPPIDEFLLAGILTVTTLVWQNFTTYRFTYTNYEDAKRDFNDLVTLLDKQGKCDD